MSRTVYVEVFPKTLEANMPKRKRMMGSTSKDSDRLKCGHCHTFLSKRQFHEHKRIYYDSRTGIWKTVADLARLDTQESSSSDGM